MQSFRPPVGALVVSLAAVALLSSAGVATSGESLALGSDSPTWSPDGRMLAYVAFRAGRAGDIYTIGRDRGRERRLTRTKSHEDTPRWSPDGRTIAFVRKVENVSQIFLMNADGSGERQLTSAHQPSFSPAWSPDRRRLAFARGRDFNNARDAVDADGSGVVPDQQPGGEDAAEIHLIDVQTRVETRLTRNTAIDNSPAWSPDGAWIAFTSDRTGSGAEHLFVMRPDGTEQRKLTDYEITFHSERRPSWSPDGSTIAFVSDRDPPLGNKEIYVVDADGTNGRRLTWNHIHDDWPAWGPDGSLAIARGRTEFRPEVFWMTPDGALARKVTGKNLRFVRLTRSPQQPRAARRFVVELTVRPAVDPFTDVQCSATLADRLLPETTARLVAGRVQCAWTLPLSARGKLLRAIVFAGAGGSEVSRTVTRVVR